MAAPTVEYQVESLHLNIGQGDGAIHLLMHEISTTVDPLYPSSAWLIDKAIFVDGGKSSGNVQGKKSSSPFFDTISNTIDWIQRNYYCRPPTDGGDNILKFDAFIVTHWDADHCNGIMGFLKGDLTQNQTTKKWSLQHARYSGSGEPESHFFAPYFFKQTGNNNTDSQRMRHLWKVHHGEFEMASYTGKGFHLSIAKPGSAGFAEHQLLMRADTKFLIGRNFFNSSDNQTFGKRLSEMSSIKKLLDKNPPTSEEMPGLYCIGVNEVFLGTSETVDIIHNLPTKTDFETNESSICCMIIWKNGHCSHYFGGDVDTKGEEKIIKWFKKVEGGIGDTGVSCMKLSHHGATTSTPIDLLLTFNPVNVVASAGRSSYGHPRWEILALLELWSRYRTVPDKNTDFYSLYLASYPDWLRRADDDEFKVARKWQYDQMKQDSEFQKSYKKLLTLYENKYGKTNQDFYNFAQKFADNTVGKSETGKRGYICEEIDKLLPEYTGFATALGKSLDTGKVYYAETALQAIIVVSKKSFTARAEEGVWGALISFKDGLKLPRRIHPKQVVVPQRNPNIDTGGTKKRRLSCIGGSNRQYTPHIPSLESTPSEDSWTLIDHPEYNHPRSISDQDSRTNLDLIKRKTTTRDSPPFYLVSELSYEPSEQPQQGSVILITKTYSLFNFVSALNWQTFILDQRPNIAQYTPVAAKDGLTSWFQVFDEQKGEAGRPLEVKFSAWPPEATTKIHFKVRIPYGQSAELIMNTEDAYSVIDVENSSIINALLTDRAVMIFGLDEKTIPFTTTLLDAVKFASFLDGDPNVFTAEALGRISLTLDTNQPSPGTLSGARSKARNAMWFEPNDSYRTTLRLQFSAKGAASVINDWLQAGVGKATILDPKIILRKTSYYQETGTGDTMVTQGGLTMVMGFVIGELKLQASVAFEKQSICLTLQNDNINLSLNNFIPWLAEKLGFQRGEFDAWLDSAAKSGVLNRTSITPRRFQIYIDLDERGKVKGVSSIKMSMQVFLRVGEPAGSGPGTRTPVVFLLDFGWVPGAGGPYFTGSLWSRPMIENIYQKAMPGYEEHLEFLPITDTEGEPVKSLDLKTLMSADTVANIPSGIPTIIKEASIRLDGDGIYFRGSIVCKEPEGNSNVPRLFLEELAVDVSYTWANKASSLSVSLGVDLLLCPPSEVKGESYDPELEPAQLRGSLEFNSANKSWSLTAGVQDLTMYHIASFWPAGDSQDNVMSLLKKIRIVYLDLDYQYEKKENAPGKTLSLAGMLAVGSLHLKFDYINTGSTDWKFDASLALDYGDGDDEVTIRDILEGLVDDPPDGIPEAITSIPVGKTGKPGELFRLRCFQTGEYFISMLSISFGSVQFTFMQLRSSKWDKKRPSKRIIKAAITEFPTIDVKIIGKLKQPFDQLFFLWVGDKGGDKPELRGLTQPEIKAINEAKDIDDGEKLFFKLNKKEEEYTENDVALKQGCHFIVVMKTKPGTSNDNVLLDYAFGGDKKKPNALSMSPNNELVVRSAEGADNKGSKAPLKKSMGPLSIENISLEYDSVNKRLGVILDATFLMGPLGLSLLGFGFDFPFDKTTNLKNPPKLKDFQPKLSGMLVAFERGPLSVAGGFKYSKEGNMEVYSGGLVVNYKPWMFQAAGSYAVVPKGWPKANSAGEVQTYSSVFIFFKLHGPLFSVGWADISGLTGGFGVNSDINVPTVTNVLDFPFVKPDATGPEGGSTMDTLKNLLNGVWFQPSEGKFWVAAGLKVNAFQMLSVQAVLVLQFNPSLKMGIYGVAVCDVPSAKSPVKFAHVELGIVCTLDIDAGTFKVEAQLSPNSFVLHPSCHLTGGFALFSWFKDGPNAVAGDWVMTIGGYHQAFIAPTQYPRPPRLRISWSLGKHLKVTGEAYFAITPKVCMGGGRLHASLSLGPLYAYFDAYVDFLINYQPFYFQAEGGVAVGVRFTLDLWLVTIRISVEIGASLMLRGPPMGGVVHVDFWVFGFDIKFGSSPRSAPVLDLKKFWETALKASSSASGKAITSGDNVNTDAEAEKAFLINCEAGLEPEDKKETKEGADWLVHASSFAFTSTLKFAANKAALIDNRIADAAPQDIPIDAQYKGIYARPMELSNSLNSNVEISVFQKAEDLEALRHISGAELLAFVADKREWRITPIVKSMPQNIWGSYSRGMDPSKSGNHVGGLLNGKDVSTPLVMGFSIRPPEPKMADDKIRKFNIVKDMMQSVSTDTTVPKIPPPGDGIADKAWNPKKSNMDEIKKKWNESGKFKPEDVVNRWAARLKFGAAKKPLTGARPTQLLARYDSMVPAAPALAVGN